METGSKMQTGILGLTALSVLVLSIVTMAVCLSLRTDLRKMADGSAGVIQAGGTVAAEGTEAEGQAEMPRPIYVLTLEEGSLTARDSAGEVHRQVRCHGGFLPAGDVAALREGIAVFTEEELEALIEDFTS